jgi:transposase
MSSPVWIGVDIAKNTFAAARREGQGFLHCSFEQTPQGFGRFLQWLPAGEVALCLEATGPYWRRLAAFLEARSPAVGYVLANPRRVHNFAKAFQRRSKTDQADAELLVQFAETFEPPSNPAVERVYGELRALERFALQLQQTLDLLSDREEKMAADPATPAFLLKIHKQHRNYVRRLLEKVLAEADRQIKTDEEVAQVQALLCSIKGIGKKTALTLLGEYGAGILSANPRELTSYAGLEILLWESGTSVAKPPRISKQGNWRLRRGLYMAALVGVRYNPILKAFYGRQIQKGLAPKSALVASMRKLLHLCYGVLKHRQPFDPNYPSLPNPLSPLPLPAP